MHQIDWFRLAGAAFFTGVGAWQLFMGTRGGRACETAPQTCDELETASTRIARAYARRRSLAQIPVRTVFTIGGALALGIAVLTLVTTIPFSTLYGVFALSIAAALTYATTRLRRMRKRVAILAPALHPAAFAPWYLQVLASALVLSPLLWFSQAPFGAVFCTLAGLSILVLAQQIAAMPSALTGEDVDVEMYVDSRVRRQTVTTLWAVSIAPGFVFESFASTTNPWLHGVVFAGLLSIFVCNVSVSKVFRERPSEAQLALWSHDGA